MAEHKEFQNVKDLRSFLVFGLQNRLLAVDALAVREIRGLMEITPIEEAPYHVPGVVNLRGDILPVVDLNLRFGYERQRYRPTDSIVILDAGAARFGMIVTEVNEVIAISPENIEPTPFLSFDAQISTRFITKIARTDSKIIMIVDHGGLLTASASDPETADSEDIFRKISTDGYFCPEADPEERAIFRNRAQAALHIPTDETLAHVVPTAVVGLNQEYFGVDLELVQEFSNIYGLTPIPCSPSHIVGNMNLRGNILTVVDIRGLLGMSTAGEPTADKAIVVNLRDIFAGIAVEEIYDIAFLKPSDIKPIPSVLQKSPERYLKGTFLYGGKVMTLLNLAGILSSEELTAGEEV